MFDGDVEGEPLIWRGRSDPWRDAVPKPVSEEGSYALESAMEAHGCPPKPKPDMSFGYNDDAFDYQLLLARKSLPKECVVYTSKPWFPYMVKEWKSSLESPAKAQQQARRDDAAAADTTYRFFKHAYPDQEPSASLTCIFSICVKQQAFEYRVHWRHIEADGRVSWEGDPVASAFYYDAKQVFNARSAILKTLDWVRGARLTAIRNALKVLATRQPPTLTSVPPLPYPPTPPVSTARARGLQRLDIWCIRDRGGCHTATRTKTTWTNSLEDSLLSVARRIRTHVGREHTGWVPSVRSR